MIQRLLEFKVEKSLKRSPAVAILGPRQVGKTTLAKKISGNTRNPAIYTHRISQKGLLFAPIIRHFHELLSGELMGKY
jgi:AAA+ ATPase superfamily predicted ATPase